MRRNQHVYMIWHHHEAMQVVTMKPSLTVLDGVGHELRDFLLPQEHWTIPI